MSKTKIAVMIPEYLQGRSEHALNSVPEGMEAYWVNSDLPDEDLIQLCRDADAILSIVPNVSPEVLKHCPNIKILQILINSKTTFIKTGIFSAIIACWGVILVGTFLTFK